MLRTLFRGVGQTLITLGLIVMLFAAYEVYGKAWQVGRERDRLDNVLSSRWKSGGEEFDVASGQPLAKMYIPALSQEWVVVEGTGTDDIKLAPGHYTNSQYPGQKGNFAVAGHRAPALFWDLDRLDDGHAIVVETALSYYVYTVYESRIVKPTDVWVVYPDPDAPATDTTEAAGNGDTIEDPQRTLLTLTTCNPKYDNYERLIVHAELESAQPKTDGKPEELRT